MLYLPECPDQAVQIGGDVTHGEMQRTHNVSETAQHKDEGQRQTNTTEKL